MDKNYFLQPTNPCQRKYEALRALFVDNLSPKEVSAKFGYSIHTIYSYQQEDIVILVNDVFFLPVALSTG